MKVILAEIRKSYFGLLVELKYTAVSYGAGAVGNYCEDFKLQYEDEKSLIIIMTCELSEKKRYTHKIYGRRKISFLFLSPFSVDLIQK